MSRANSGAAATNLVLLSIVMVPIPGSTFAIVPSAPRVSENAMMAPPCRTAGRVQRCSRTVSSATMRSGTALTRSMPSYLANGRGSSLNRARRSIVSLPRVLLNSTGVARRTCARGAMQVDPSMLTSLLGGGVGSFRTLLLGPTRRGRSTSHNTEPPASSYSLRAFCFAHRRFCARLIFFRAAADILRRFRRPWSITAAGSDDTSIVVGRRDRLRAVRCGNVLTSEAISALSSS